MAQIVVAVENQISGELLSGWESEPEEIEKFTIMSSYKSWLMFVSRRSRAAATLWS